MTDIEMLELAAKAYFPDCPRISYPLDWVRDCHGNWNPLTDDGDALRLAVKLFLEIDVSNVAISVCPPNGRPLFEKVMSDPYAATRKAVVRAAAEVGKGITQEPSGQSLPEDNFYKT